MNRPCVSAKLLTFSIASAIACGASSAAAEYSPRQRCPAVEVSVSAVVASNSGRAFDKRLAALKRSFHLFPYTSYRLIHEERRRVAWRKGAGFNLPGGRYLMVSPRGYHGRDSRVSLDIMLMQGQRSLVKTVLRLKNNGTFLVAGPQYEDGVLFISIRAATTR